jgi:hypothetical protein
MKMIRKHLSGLAIIGGLIAPLNFVHAQTIARAVQSVSVGNMDVLSVLAQARALAAAEPVLEQSIPVTATGPSAERPFGTYWSLVNNQPPMPFDPFPELPVYVVDPTNRIFVVDDRSVDFSALRAQQEEQEKAQAEVLAETMMAMKVPPPGDSGDGGTNSYTLNASGFGLPGYGTNLWIRLDGISSGNLVGIISNTVPNVYFELQSKSDLIEDPQWLSPGWGVFGAGATNWTSFSMPMSSPSNLFVRVRSWADDGSGLPIWWQLQYFGHTGVDPLSFDSSGDGLTLWQDFEAGYDPTIFHTPAAPQGLTAVLNPATSAAILTWLPSAGGVTGYTIGRFDLLPESWTYYQVGLTTRFVDISYPVYTNQDFQWYGPSVYCIQANYSNGDSEWSDDVCPYSAREVPFVLEMPGSGGLTALVVAQIPTDVSTLQLTRTDINPRSTGLNIQDTITITNFPVSAFTNGIFIIPTNLTWIGTNGITYTTFHLQAIWPDGRKSKAVGAGGPEPIFYDGRAQLEQNAVFLVRAAELTDAFTYGLNGRVVDQPDTYAYASYYDVNYWTGSGLGNESWQNWQRPFTDNYRYRNFLYVNNTNLDSSGFLTTGVYLDGSGTLNLPSTPVFQFSAPTTNTTIPALDASTCMQPYTDYQPLGMYVNGSSRFVLPNNIYNHFGLHLSSVLLAHNHNGTLYLDTLNAGGTWPQTNDTYYFYPQFDQPQFQTVGYYFGRMENQWTGDSNSDPLPGDGNFSPTNTSPLLIVGMGVEPIQIAAFAKKIMINGDTTKPVYVGQYFDKAYKVDTNGIVTTNQTGVLSPLGDFFPTEPGPVALVTMPDINTGQRGTGIVYVVKLQLDANNDGNMDLSFFGADQTYFDYYPARPFKFWINNGYIQPGNGTTLDTDKPVYQNQVNYSTTNLQPNSSYGQIRCQRNLENFARLWICGLPSLPASQGYTAVLSLYESIGSLNLYPAYETDGGTRYLTDTNMAAAQVAPPYGTALAQLADTGDPSTRYTLPVDSNGQLLWTHFLFEGVSASGEQLVLTVYKNGQRIVQTAAYLDVEDIKSWYEQAHVTNVIQTWPEMVQQSATSGFQVDHYLPNDPSRANQLAVFVHGWRMTQFDYEDFSDTMFKRLYWQGFQGRFASLRWPTRSAETDTNGLDYLTFNRSEHMAFESGTGAAAYFNNLRQRFTNDTISVCGHSQGNIVLMEALKELAAANQSPLDNYIMMQAAVPAHCYDTTVPNFPGFINEEQLVPTPNTYANYAAGINNALRGQIVNFFNTNDYALVSASTNIYGINFNTSWIANEELTKPLAVFGYSYNPTNSTAHLTNVAYGVTGRTVTNLFELMPFVARPRSLAVGSQSGVGNMVNGGQLDLKTLNFTGNDYDHSGQFNRNIQMPPVRIFYTNLVLKLFP